MGGCRTPKRPGPIGSIGTTSRGCGIPRSSWIWVVPCQTDHQHCLKPVSTCEGSKQSPCGRTWCVRGGRRSLLFGVLTQNPEIVPTRNRFGPDPSWEGLSWVVLSGSRRSRQKCWGKCWGNLCLRWRVRHMWSPVELFATQLKEHPLRIYYCPKSLREKFHTFE